MNFNKNINSIKEKKKNSAATADSNHLELPPPGRSNLKSSSEANLKANFKVNFQVNFWEK